MTTVRRHRVSAVLLAAAAALSYASVALAGGEPVNRSAPELSRSALELTTTNGAWVGATRPFAYEWLRCSSTSMESCSPLADQEDSTYVLRREDVGSRIRSRVTASNAAGSTAEPSGAFGPVREDLFTARPMLLRPKPVVVIAGLRRGRFTFVDELSVRGPEGALVRLRCRGRGCPVRRIRTRIGSRQAVRLRRAQGTYRAGNVLEIRVLDAERERTGKFTRVRFRANGATPRRTDACLEPGARRSSPCP